jgi:hypothetical protein
MDCLVFEGYLNSVDDIDRLIYNFSGIGKAADKATFSEERARQLWFNLTEGGVDRNVYCVTMPYLCKAVLRNNSTIQHRFEFTEKTFRSLGIEPNNTTVILFSSTLRMQIKEKPEDEFVKRTAIWVPPRDFRLLYDEPAPKCYLEIFLTDLKFIANYGEDGNAKISVFDYLLSKSSACTKAWIEFKHTFLGDT